MKTKKASLEIGGAIIGIALLLLLFGIFLDSDGFFESRPTDPDDRTISDTPILFQLNNTELGREKVDTQSFPNIVLGSQREYTNVYSQNLIELTSNPFTQSSESFTLTPSQNKTIEQYLIYATPAVQSGDARLLVYQDDELIGTYPTTGQNFPIPIRNIESNRTTQIDLKLEKPPFYSLFSWNKVELRNFYILESSKEKENQKREFNFQVDEEFLEDIAIELSISCQERREVSPAIEILVNGYIIANENPNCLSHQTTISSEIPKEILEDKNTLELKTSGFYTVAHSIQARYFNDKNTYSFSLSSLENLNDIILYGDFDKESIDLRINGNTIDLNRNEIKSILPYLRQGNNEIVILTKPLSIKELVVEAQKY